ncbi:hypothetical protein IEQ34_020875 [Dendrobium chrysotoxum]|uniref:Uncharacterized protein n=1 Tax=Dendrobium chrysotoxum TaxID=161865 RepID=A0AAV7G464_DENCH|nr:hypothetical protein IEQ34_020875 [Dendrobium chrysotoxum]
MVDLWDRVDHIREPQNNSMFVRGKWVMFTPIANNQVFQTLNYEFDRDEYLKVHMLNGRKEGYDSKLLYLYPKPRV